MIDTLVTLIKWAVIGILFIPIAIAWTIWYTMIFTANLAIELWSMVKGKIYQSYLEGLDRAGDLELHFPKEYREWCVAHEKKHRNKKRMTPQEKSFVLWLVDEKL